MLCFKRCLLNNSGKLFTESEMLLPEPKKVQWEESHFDFGHIYSVSIRVGNLRHAVRINIKQNKYPNDITSLKNVLLKWYWRKLGAA